MLDELDQGALFDVPKRAVPPLSALLRPELPDVALTGLPGLVATELAAVSGADPAALLVMFLVMFGNAVGAQPHAVFGGAPQPGRLFVLVVGDAAAGRKGTAYEAVEPLFQVADPDWADTRLEFGLQSAEALVDRVADGCLDPRLLIVETEFGRLVRAMQRGGGLSAQLRNAYDGRPLQRSIASRSKSQEAKHAHVSLLGMITPGELLRLHRQLREAGGLESRILYCYSAPRDAAESSPFSTAAVERNMRLAGLVRDALIASRDRVMAQTDPVSAYLCAGRGIQPRIELPVCDDVAGGWLSRVRPVLPRAEESMAVFFARAETHVMRLAVLYALADQAPRVEFQHVEAATGLWSYCASSAERVFGIPVGDLPPRANPAHVAKVTRYLHDAWPSWCSRDQIRTQVLSGNVPAASVDAIMGVLMASRMVHRQVVQTKGRPCTEYRLAVTA